MASSSFGDLLAQAKKEGFGVVLDDGTYEFEVVAPPKVDKTQGSPPKPRFSSKVKVVGGPNDGASVFYNVVLTLDNPKAMAVFFKQMDALGLNDAYFAALGEVNDAAIAKMANDALPVGKRFTAQVTHHEYKGQVKNDLFPQPATSATPAVPAPPVAAAPVVPAPPVPDSAPSAVPPRPY